MPRRINAILGLPPGKVFCIQPAQGSLTGNWINSKLDQPIAVYQSIASSILGCRWFYAAQRRQFWYIFPILFPVEGKVSFLYCSGKMFRWVLHPLKATSSTQTGTRKLPFLLQDCLCSGAPLWDGDSNFHIRGGGLIRSWWRWSLSHSKLESPRPIVDTPITRSTRCWFILRGCGGHVTHDYREDTTTGSRPVLCCTLKTS